jgi:AraC-like DNA-binding protein
MVSPGLPLLNNLAEAPLENSPSVRNIPARTATIGDQRHRVRRIRRAGESFLRLPDNKLIPHFIHSLMPYYNGKGEMELQPELSGVFFDYGIPAKIDLEAFMNRNYRFNVRIDRFAYLTGRSLSAFKRDFQAIFEIYIDLGFEALSHFSFAFKKLFGQTPTELSARKNDT